MEDLKFYLESLETSNSPIISDENCNDLYEIISIFDSLAYATIFNIGSSELKKLKTIFIRQSANNIDDFGIAFKIVNNAARNLFSENMNLKSIKNRLIEYYSIKSKNIPYQTKEIYDLIHRFDLICEKYKISKHIFYLNKKIKIQNNGLMIYDTEIDNGSYKIDFSKNSLAYKNIIFNPKFIHYKAVKPIIDEIEETLRNIYYGVKSFEIK